MFSRLIAVLAILSLVVGGYTHRLKAVMSSVLPAMLFAGEVMLSLALVMAVWLSLMGIVRALGWLTYLTDWLKPLLLRLFPQISAEDPVLDLISLNMAANMLGMGNAATPFGLKAMRALEAANPNPGVATDSMCLFLAINTSSVQLLPVTTIGILAVGGATHPLTIFFPVLIATSVSTLVGVFSAKWFATWRWFRLTSSPRDFGSLAASRSEVKGS